MIDAVDLHVAAAIFRNEYPIADLHLEGKPVALVGALAVADSDNLCLLRLFLSGVRDDDPTADDLFGLEPTQQDTVCQWLDVRH